jgi:hypothetical protein
MRILIGTVTSNIKDYCWVRFAKQLRALQNQGHDVLIIDNSVKTQNRRGFKVINYKPFHGQKLQNVTKECMNILRDEFLKGDYTHLFILESDVFISEDTVDRLLSMDSDIANFTYLMKLERFNEYSLCVQSTTKEGVSRMLTPEDSSQLLDTGIKTLGKDMLNDKMLTHCGYGCTLIKRKVLEKIVFRDDKTPDDIYPYPDSYFHLDAQINKFSNKLDTDWLPEHCNLHDETKLQRQIIQIQSKTTRRQRRATR